jgi:putative CocE/NonD family hydrolase
MYVGHLQQGDLQYPEAVKGDRTYTRKFFDYWLKGDDNGFYDEPPIYYYQMGEEAWKFAEEWPPRGTSNTNYYLHSSGQLSPTAPTGPAEPTEYTFDPNDPSPGIGGPYLWPTNFHPDPVIGPAYQDKKVLSGRDDDHLIYDMPVLVEDLEIAGSPLVKLFIECNTPDTDIIVRLCDYNPSAPMGKQTLLVGIKPQRMRYRESLRYPVWMEPGKIYEVDIEMDPVAYTWEAGHQVRMIVSSSAYPLYAINPNNKEHFIENFELPDPSARVANVKLWSNTTHSSYLELPLQGEEPACDGGKCDEEADGCGCGTGSGYPGWPLAIVLVVISGIVNRRCTRFHMLSGKRGRS